MKMRPRATRLTLFAALTVAALCQSCVRDVATPEEEPGDWIDIQAPPTVYLDANAIAADRHGTLYLGGDRHAALWRSTDRGLTWTQKSLGLKPFCEVTALVVKGGETVFAALGGGGVFISRNHGDSWTQVNSRLTDLNILSLAAAADGAIIAGASSGKIFRSINDGGVWVEAEGDSIRREVNALVTDSAGVVYAGSSGRGIFFSADSGRTWAPSSGVPGSFYIRCLALHKEGYVLAGAHSSIYRSAGAGEPWVRIDRGAISGGLYAMATDPAGNIFAGGAGRGVFCSRDGGDSWEGTGIGLRGLYIRSLFCAQDVLLAGTMDGGVFRSTDGGMSWSSPRNYFPADPDLYENYWSPCSITIDSCGTYYLLDERSIVKSRDGGETWIMACADLPWRKYCLAIHPNSSLFVATSLGVFTSNDSGDSWSRADTSSSGYTEVYSLEVAQNGVIFGLNANSVIRSKDGGSSWENVLDAAGVKSISTGSAGRVYIGTDYRGVLGSTDGGDTWRRITDSTTVWSIEADRVGNVFVMLEDRFLRSIDGGDTWKTIPLGEGPYYNCSVVAAPGGEIAAVFDGHGTLYISEDRFSSWKTVSVPYGPSAIYLSPDGHLFLSGRFYPGGLHRSRNAMF